MSGTLGDPIPDSIRDEAARWLARREGDAGKGVEAEFLAWLERDLRHRLAYAEIERAWRESRLLADTDIGRSRSLARAPFHMRRSTHVVAVSLAVLVTVGLLSVRFVGVGPMIEIGGAVEARSYQTASGETRTWRLDDGSSLTLESASRAQVQISAVRRSIELMVGHASIHAARNDAVPLEIRARVLSAHTGDALLEVTVAGDEGRIGVVSGVAEATLPDGETRQLSAGQAVTTQASAAARTSAVGELSRPTLLPASDLTVGQAVALLNRQNTVQIRLASRDIAERRLSGGFRVDDPEAFARTVAAVNGLEVVSAGQAIDLRPRS